MAYVQRDNEGKVVGVFSCRQDFATEELADGHPEVMEVRTPVKPRSEPSVADMVRALVKGDAEKIAAFKQKLEEADIKNDRLP